MALFPAVYRSLDRFAAVEPSRDQHEQIISRLALGPHRMVLLRDATGRIWIEQRSTERRWRSEVAGLMGVYRTDPRAGLTHWALAGLVGSDLGVPGTVTGVSVWLEGREVARAGIQELAWIVGLPSEAACWKPTVSFLNEDGSRWGSAFQFPQRLEEALGSQAGSSPDGSGWSPYASIQ